MFRAIPGGQAGDAEGFRQKRGAGERRRQKDKGNHQRHGHGVAQAGPNPLRLARAHILGRIGGQRLIQRAGRQIHHPFHPADHGIRGRHRLAKRVDQPLYHQMKRRARHRLQGDGKAHFHNRPHAAGGQRQKVKGRLGIAHRAERRRYIKTETGKTRFADRRQMRPRINQPADKKSPCVF